MNTPAPITFLVHGSPLSGGYTPAAQRGTAGDTPSRPAGQLKASIGVATPQRGSTTAPHRLEAVPGVDLVLLHLQDGPMLVLHPANARALLLAQQGAAQRGGATEVPVPSELAWPGTAQRGLLKKVLLKAIEVLTGVAADQAANLLASQVVQRVDGQVAAGVYQLQVPSLPKLKDSGLLLAQLPAAPRGAPLLVLIHGTFVDTPSTFSKLWQGHAEQVRSLFQQYSGRVYALDHPTLGSSPITNALTLARCLPTGAELHLLTHSRGGLVAEVLVRAAALAAGPGLDTQELAVWADQGERHYRQHREELKALVQLLAQRQVRISRVLRVACPARGTLLASRRLDAYLSVLQWSLQLAGVPVLPGLVDLLGEVARRRADPTLIPGLEAMMPDSALVRWLNRPLPAGASAPGELRVVAGEVQKGNTVMSWVQALAADALYWTDNDIVVHTAAMFGGTPRPAGSALFLRAQGSDATHFDYFSTQRTALSIVQGLLQAQPPGYQPIGAQSWAGQDSGGLRGRSAASADSWHLVDSQAGQDTEAVQEAPALQLGVLNGNLKFVAQPLLIGHYLALQLTGTEAVMDRLLGGVMHQSLRAGLYPDSLGAHRIFTNLTIDPDRPRRPPRPAAVIVVGLGEEGGLRSNDLAASVRQAVLAEALRLGEQTGASMRFTLASTLLGSGGTGISAGAAAQAITQGVREANERLQQVGWPQVGRLEFVELFLDRATEAWQALQVLEEAVPLAYALDAVITHGTGCLRRPLQAGYRGAGHDLVSAVAGGPSNSLSGQDTPIEFTLGTRRARSEVRALAPQSTLVRQMVATAARDGQADTEIGRSLFQLLVPSELEPFLTGSRLLLLELDDSTAGIPWELLDPSPLPNPLFSPSPNDSPPPAEPWALRCQLLRKLRTRDYRPQPVAARRDAPVLVIGEPLCDRPDFPPLPGARAEADAVAQLMSQHAVDTLHLDQADALQVVNGLMSRDWRLIHLAGHGLYDSAGGGMVLSGQALLGPREIQAMRSVPELVFINCCHLAHEDSGSVLRSSLGAERPLFAANTARQLIANGVRCVVACGWAVSDTAAQAFAQGFYSALLRGRRFIEAVSQARRAAWLAEPGNNTWAAYQCYGDPDWTWQARPKDSDGSEGSNGNNGAAPAVVEGLVSPAELCLRLEALAVDGQFGNRDSAEALAMIGALERQGLARWAGMGAVWEALAVAYAESGALDEAIRCHAQAAAAEDASASIRSSEQWANLLARRAAEAVQAAGAPRGKRWTAAVLATARADLTQAQSLLQGLLQVHATVERLSLLASVCKRRMRVEAAAQAPEAARVALADMSRLYAEAATRSTQLGLAPARSFLARHNLACCLLWQAPQAVAAAVQELRSELLAQTEDDPDFWTYAGLAEIDMIEALAQGTLASILPRVLEAYNDLHQRMPAPRLWRSVHDQALFIQQALALQTDTPPDPGLQALIDLLRTWTAA